MYINTPKMLFLFLFLYKNYINTTKMSNSFDIWYLIFAFIFSEYLHTLHAHCVLHTRERQKLWRRVSFFNRRVPYVHDFWFPATFITDKFWSDPPLRRSHRHIAPVQSFYYMQFIAPSLCWRKLWGQISPQPLNFF